MYFSPLPFLSECPEEVYDPRSLYERLQEQKDRKQQEYEEQFKFSKLRKKQHLRDSAGPFWCTFALCNTFSNQP